MSDDMTFCYNYKCINKSCDRHPTHIQQPEFPHSFSLFEDCGYWETEELLNKSAWLDKQLEQLRETGCAPKKVDNGMIKGTELEDLVGDISIAKNNLDILLYVSDRDEMIAEGYVKEKLYKAKFTIERLLDTVGVDDDD